MTGYEVNDLARELYERWESINPAPTRRKWEQLFEAERTQWISVALQARMRAREQLEAELPVDIVRRAGRLLAAEFVARGMQVVAAKRAALPTVREEQLDLLAGAR